MPSHLVFIYRITSKITIFGVPFQKAADTAGVRLPEYFIRPHEKQANFLF
jgi:hypothetical protein